jgi:hypothetical protein
MSPLKANRPLQAGESASASEAWTASSLNHTPTPNQSQSPLLTSALSWLERGVPLVPIQPRSKHLVRGYGPCLKRITTPGEAIAWFGSPRACNLGLICGDRVGLVVLDFDLLTEYESWCYQNRALAKTYTERSARGRHVFLIIGDVPSGKVCKIEIKGAGSVIMVAPSMHPSGVRYTPLDESATILHAGDDFPLLSALGKKEPPRGVLSHAATAIAGRDDVITRIKVAWPILPLAESMTKLTSADGRWYHGSCPLPGHRDHKPSFWVDAERGTFGCYACHVRGDAINLFAFRNGLALNFAIKVMARRLPPGGAA